MAKNSIKPGGNSHAALVEYQEQLGEIESRKRSADTAGLDFVSNSESDNATQESKLPKHTINRTERPKAGKLPRAMNDQTQHRIASSSRRPTKATSEFNTSANEHLQTHHDPKIGNITYNGISHHESLTIGSQASDLMERRSKPGLASQKRRFTTNGYLTFGHVPCIPAIYAVVFAVKDPDFLAIYEPRGGFRIDIRPGGDCSQFFTSEFITLPTVEFVPKSTDNFTYALAVTLPGCTGTHRTDGALHITILPGARYARYYRCNHCGRAFSELCQLGRCF